MKRIYNSEYDYLCEYDSECEYRLNEDNSEFVVYGVDKDFSIGDIVKVNFDDDIFYTCEVLRQYKNRHRYNTYKMRLL